MTFNDRHCSLEPELDRLYYYETYTQEGRAGHVKPTHIVSTGAEWIESFLRDMREWGHTDASDALVQEWQEKFDYMGLPYDCATRELDVDKMCLDRATKYAMK